MSNNNTTALMQKGVSTNTVCKQFTECQVVLDSINGTLIPMSSIVGLTLFEDIFSLLPTAVIDITDSGDYFNVGDLHVGQTLYIQYKPSKNYASEKARPSYISTRMKIISVNAEQNLNTLQHNYHIVCCYDALKVLSSTVPYPQRSELSALKISAEEYSVYAIMAQLAAGGLSVTEYIDSDDKMKWINTRHKICECVNKFLDHSWIAEDDAMLAFTTMVNNTAFNEKSSEQQIEEAFNAATKISSCKTLRDSAPTAYYISAKNPKNINSIRYSKISVNNKAGITTLKDAYKQVEYVYTPMGMFDTDMLNELEFQFADEVMDNANLKSFKNIYNQGIRKIEYNNPEPTMASNVSKIPDLFEGTNKLTSCGMHFYEDTHAHYDVAPAHNKAIISSFFANSVELLFDINQQVDEAYIDNRLPYVGQKVHLDTQSEDNVVSQAYTGDYIVAQVRFVVRANASTICALILISDGTYKA